MKSSTTAAKAAFPKIVTLGYGGKLTKRAKDLLRKSRLISIKQVNALCNKTLMSDAHEPGE